jgi:hypothetical protein
VVVVVLTTLDVVVVIVAFDVVGVVLAVGVVSVVYSFARLSDPYERWILSTFSSCLGTCPLAIFLHLPQGPEEEMSWRYLVQTLNIDYIRPEYVTGHDKRVLLVQKVKMELLLFPERASFTDHFDLYYTSLGLPMPKLLQNECNHVSQFSKNPVLSKMASKFSNCFLHRSLCLHF